MSEKRARENGLNRLQVSPVGMRRAISPPFMETEEFLGGRAPRQHPRPRPVFIPSWADLSPQIPHPSGRHRRLLLLVDKRRRCVKHDTDSKRRTGGAPHPNVPTGSSAHAAALGISIGLGSVVGAWKTAHPERNGIDTPFYIAFRINPSNSTNSSTVFFHVPMCTNLEPDCR